LIWGLYELYETTFKVEYLREALLLNDELIENLWDESSGAFYLSDEKDLIVRQKEIYDGAIPSGNSVTAYNLSRLGKLIANSELEQKASRIIQNFAREINNAPFGHTMSLIANQFSLSSYEVIITGDLKDDKTKKILNELNSNYIPEKIVLIKSDENSAEIIEIADYLKGYNRIDGETTVYVCRNYTCSLPTTKPGKMLELLKLSESNVDSDK
jgi:uncharacterized protein YyaL (SSP411 family)